MCFTSPSLAVIRGYYYNPRVPGELLNFCTRGGPRGIGEIHPIARAAPDQQSEWAVGSGVWGLSVGVGEW